MPGLFLYTQRTTSLACTMLFIMLELISTFIAVITSNPFSVAFCWNSSVVLFSTTYSFKLVYKSFCVSEEASTLWAITATLTFSTFSFTSLMMNKLISLPLLTLKVLPAGKVNALSTISLSIPISLTHPISPPLAPV